METEEKRKRERKSQTAPQKQRTKNKKTSYKKGIERLENVWRVLTTVKWLLPLIIVVVVVIGIAGLMRANPHSFLGSIGQKVGNAIVGENGKVTTITESTLEDVFEISELSTVDFAYNAVARFMESDGKTARYYVAYKGTVRAGIDFSKIDIQIDREAKRIDLHMPEAEIQDTTVDFGSMEYIFEDKKYETETVSQEAYALCRKDLKERSVKEEQLLTMARENAVSVVEALVLPWVQQIDAAYVVNIQ